MSIKQNITSLQNLLEQVNALPDAGVELPELTNQAEASELFLNKELIDSNGNKVTGTFTIDSELSEQDDLIAQIASALKDKSAGSGDTGSAMQFATGMFVPTSQDISTNPVTVSGLNFEPKSLEIALYGNDNGAILYIPARGSYLMALATGELFDDYSLIMKKALSNGGIQQSDVFSVELTQDGFILKSTTTTDGMLMSQYIYSAFG